MAETIRDLAFKVSLNMNLTGLKTADNEVTKLRDKIKNMSRSVNKDVGMINNSFGQIKTFKAVNRIDKITKSVVKLKGEMGGLSTAGVGGKGSTGGTPKSPRTRTGGSGGTNPFGSRAANLGLVATIATSLVLGKILKTKAKIQAIQMITTKGGQNILNQHRKISATLKKQAAQHSKIRDILGETKFKALGGANGIGKMALKAFALVAAMKVIRMATREAAVAADMYKDKIDGLIRQEAFYANALKFREKVLGESLNTGANTFEEYKKASNASVMATRKNIDAIKNQGVISGKVLTAITGQMASFQINTDKWFGGEKGMKNIEKLADLTASIYGAGATQGNAINLANMIGKADTMHLFGQLQRWGIVLSDTQKQIIKTGDADERLGAIMEGLDQNVGNFNKTLLNTPFGKYSKELNKLQEKQAELGETVFAVKTAFLQLKNSLYPVISGIVRNFGIMLGVIAKGIAMIANGFNSLSNVVGGLTGTVAMLALAFIPLGGIVGLTFAPFIAAGLAITLVVEDLWTTMHGGEGITKGLVTSFRTLKETLSPLGKVLGELFDKMGGMKTLRNVFRAMFAGLASPIKAVIDGITGILKGINAMINIAMKAKNLFKDDGSQAALGKKEQSKLRLSDAKTQKTSSFSTTKETVNNNNTKSKIVIDKGSIPKAVTAPKVVNSSLDKEKMYSKKDNGTVIHLTQTVGGVEMKGTYTDKEVLKQDMMAANTESVNRAYDAILSMEGGDSDY